MRVPQHAARKGQANPIAASVIEGARFYNADVVRQAFYARRHLFGADAIKAVKRWHWLEYTQPEITVRIGPKMMYRIVRQPQVLIAFESPLTAFKKSYSSYSAFRY